MTRLFTDGAETGNVGNFTAVASFVASTTKKNTGNYSYRVGGSGGGNAGSLSLSSALSEFYFRSYFYVDGNTYYSKLLSWYSGGTELGSIRLNNTTSNILLYTSTSTLVATSTTKIEQERWYMLEAHVKIADSGGIIEIKIDGLADATGTFTGDTKPGAATTCNYLYLGGTQYVYYDDIAINDTTGATDNSWCGDGHVIALKPNANGDSSDLVGSDGNSTDNYALVDDVPNDGDTTYVESSTGDDYDLYNLSASGLDATHVIQRVWTESIAKDTTTAGGQIKHVIKTNSTEYDSDAIDLSTSYALNKGAEQLVNPQTSAAWTPTELDALQVGVKIVA